MDTEALYQGIQSRSYWKTFKEKFELSQEGVRFQPSTIGLFLTSAFKGAASTLVLEILRDGAAYRGLSKRLANRAVALAQAGIVLFMTTSYISTVTGIAVNEGLTYMGASPSLSSALGSTAAIVVSIASGDMVTPTGLIASIGGGIVGGALALKIKDKVSSWLWRSETIESIKTKI